MKQLPRIRTVVEIRTAQASGGMYISGPKYITSYGNLEFIKREIQSRGEVETIEGGQSLYICKNSTLPRFKVRNFCQINGLHKSKLPQESHIALINLISTNDLLTRNERNFYLLPIKDLPKYSDFRIALTKEGDKFQEAESVVFYEHNIHDVDNFLSMAPEIIYKKKEEVRVAVFEEWGMEKEKASFENLFEIMFNKECKIKYDETAFEQLNEKGHEFEDIDNIESMLKSDDEENVLLALELLANSNYKEEKLRIAALISNYWKEIKKYRRLWNPNFKSLYSQLESDGYKVDRGWRAFSSNLLHKNPSKEIHNYVTKYVYENLRTEMNAYGIKIKSVELE